MSCESRQILLWVPCKVDTPHILTKSKLPISQQGRHSLYLVKVDIGINNSISWESIQGRCLNLVLVATYYLQGRS